MVNEFYFEEGVNPIAEFFKTAFAQRGKLRPKRQNQPKVKADRAEKADLLIHIVKGKDVPARAKAASQVKQFREQALGQVGYQSGFASGGFRPGYGFQSGTQNFGSPPQYGTQQYGTQQYGSPGKFQNNPPYGSYPGYPGQDYSQGPRTGSPPRDQYPMPGYQSGYPPRYGSVS